MELARHGGVGSTSSTVPINTNYNNNTGGKGHSQHSYSRPNALVLADSEMPASPSSSASSPSFLPEMPQWKRELIQRRKQKDAVASGGGLANEQQQQQQQPSGEFEFLFSTYPSGLLLVLILATANWELCNQ